MMDNSMSDERQGLVQGGAVQPGYLEQDFFGGRATILTDQKFELLEALCGCEVKNRYMVGVPDSAGKLAPGTDFLFMHEHSECCERICCSVNREMTLNLRQGALPAQKADYESQPLHMAMHKPFHCSHCCFMYPSMNVTTAQGAPLGNVQMPTCCKVYQQIYRPGDRLPTFEVGPVSCCQTAIVCPCCADLVIPVTQQGKEVASFTHHKFTCCELLGMMNRMSVDFGSVQDPKDRAMLFASMMLLELEWFEKKQSSE